MGTKEKCVIISSGDCMTSDVTEIVSNALIVCADGGIDNALKMGITPHVLIGDGDSMCRETNVKVNYLVSLPTEKDVTDTTACIEYAVGVGCKEIYLLCCSGGRADHMISNIFTLEYLYNRNIKAIFCDDFNEIQIIGSGIHFIDRSDKYKYLSIIPLDIFVEGVTLKGLKYPLYDYTLCRESSSLGVSNEFVSQSAEISISNGRCLLIRSRDKRN